MTLWWKVSRFTVEFTFLEEDTVTNFGVLPNSQEDEFHFEGHRQQASRMGFRALGVTLQAGCHATPLGDEDGISKVAHWNGRFFSKLSPI